MKMGEMGGALLLHGCARDNLGKRKKLLSLMVQMDNYSDYLLLWSPRDKKLWYLDIEHRGIPPSGKMG